MTQTTQTLPLELVLDAVNQVVAKKRAGAPKVTADTRLHDLGLNSLESAEVFTILEDRSGLLLDPDSARWHKTVGELTQLRAASE